MFTDYIFFISNHESKHNPNIPAFDSKQKQKQQLRFHSSLFIWLIVKLWVFEVIYYVIQNALFLSSFFSYLHF